MTRKYINEYQNDVKECALVKRSAGMRNYLVANQTEPEFEMTAES